MAGSTPLTKQEFLSHALCLEQIQRIESSKTFHGATTLQTLLRFLATEALADHPREVKEYTIGIEALGRRQNFDPKVDPIVRVQVYRLRQKLREYYDSEGSADAVLVGIPKGHYVPRFEAGSVPAGAPRSLPSAGPESHRDAAMPPPGTPASHFSAIAAGVLLLLVVTTVAGAWTYLHRRPVQALTVTPPQEAANSSDPVKAFWAPFLREDSSPIIAYADAMFLVDRAGDLFRFRRGAADDRGVPVDPHITQQYASGAALTPQTGPLYYENGYTGTGELRAIAMLVALFTQMGATPRVESSYDLSTDDLKQHNAILLGSSFQNTAVAQLPPLGDFRFVDFLSVNGPWGGHILDTHPRPNEEPSYSTVRDPATHMLEADYALIWFQPGVVTGHEIIGLGGLDTTGTAGAALLVTSKGGVDKLLKTLSAIDAAPLSRRLPPFQALVRVDLEKGYQVLDSQIIAVHTYNAGLQASARAPAQGRK